MVLNQILNRHHRQIGWWVLGQRRQRAGHLHGLDPSGWADLIEELWDEQRAQQEAAADGFVSDRSSLDYAAFWLHYGLFDEDATAAWIERMAAASSGYRHVLLFPWGALPIAADGVRSTNRWVQLRFQTILEGLLERYLPAETLLRLPPETDFNARLAWTRASIEP